jgi:hypothetical protein
MAVGELGQQGVLDAAHSGIAQRGGRVAGDGGGGGGELRLAPGEAVVAEAWVGITLDDAAPLEESRAANPSRREPLQPSAEGPGLAVC